MTAPTPDFTGLTEAQALLLSYAGWHPDSKRPQPRQATVRKLIERGLVVKTDVVFMGVRVPTYTVPTAIHMAWCSHCAEYGEQPQERRA